MSKKRDRDDTAGNTVRHIPENPMMRRAIDVLTRKTYTLGGGYGRTLFDLDDQVKSIFELSNRQEFEGCLDFIAGCAFKEQFIHGRTRKLEKGELKIKDPLPCNKVGHLYKVQGKSWWDLLHFRVFGVVDLSKTTSKQNAWILLFAFAKAVFNSAVVFCSTPQMTSFPSPPHHLIIAEDVAQFIRQELNGIIPAKPRESNIYMSIVHAFCTSTGPFCVDCCNWVSPYILKNFSAIFTDIRRAQNIDRSMSTRPIWGCLESKNDEFVE